jgi:hypothetical protein
VAAVAGGVAGAVVIALVIVVLARLVAAVASLDSATRELGRAVEDIRGEAIVFGLGGVDRSAGPAVRSDGDANGDAVGVTGRVERGALLSSGRAGANGRALLPDLRLVSPVIKARALGRGTSLAARQFRQRRER